MMSSVERMFGEAENGRSSGETGDRVRPLGAAERLVQLLSIDRPRDFCVIAELVTDLPWGDFRSAFDQVQRRHALLRVEIRDDRDVGMAFHNTDRSIALAFRPLSSGDDWRDVVEGEFARPLDGRKGPLMRATILVETKRAQIVLTFHHSIADAIAAAVIIRDLMTALRGAKLTPLPVTISVEDEQAMLSSSRPADAADGLKTRPVPDASQATVTRPPVRELERDQPAVWTLEMSEILTRDLRVGARANATTVHGTICAALALSVCKGKEPEDYAILTPINVRGTLALRPDQFGLYQAINNVRLSVRSSTPFWDLARQVTSSLSYSRGAAAVSNAIKAIETNLPIDASREIANDAFGSFHYDAVVSNLGVLPIPEVAGSIRVASFWAPMFAGRLKGQRVIGAVTAGGQLRLVETSPRYLGSVLGQMHDRIEEALALGAT